MAHRFNGHFSRLESDERKKTLPAKSVLKAIGIKKGSTIIDFGCGIGYFSIPALKFVGKSGKVIAIDISDDMINELKNRSNGLDNLKIVKSDKIKGFKGDIILLVNVLHEVDNPRKFLRACLKSLNPKGRVVIIDWQKKETEKGPPLSHRISKKQVISLLENKYKEHDIESSLYFLEFKK
ncbi:MAG: Arsenite methyltransferase [Candidatus Woesearchaeota archaeon]|nr:Arsenite methyltransferase [Candidatus Woesearchaeota archaeon]